MSADDAVMHWVIAVLRRLRAIRALAAAALVALGAVTLSAQESSPPVSDDGASREDESPERVPNDSASSADERRDDHPNDNPNTSPIQSPPVTRVRAETLRARVAAIESGGVAAPASSEDLRARPRGGTRAPGAVAPGDAPAAPGALAAPGTSADSGASSSAAPSPSRPKPRRLRPTHPGPSYVGEDMQELHDIRAEIARVRERAADLSGREEGVLRSLDDIEREIELQDRLLRGLLDRRERVLGVLVESRAELDWANDELARRQHVFLGRLSAMYKLGKYHEYEILLGSRSFVDLVRRYDYVLSVAARDREMHRGVVRQKQEVEEREEELRRTAAEISQIEAEAEVERAHLVERREERVQMLAEIRGERRSGAEALAELEESATRLQRLITTFEERREIAEAKRSELPTLEPVAPPAGLPEKLTGLAARAGSLEWPSDGRVVSAFGRHVHPEFGTATFNSGIDIEAEAGMPIRCVAAGVVEYISSVPGYGNCVIVNHEDGFYTVYAHASEVLVKQGSSVAEGQIIARVGSTGSLAGDRLHFEVRDRKKPVDPLLWLKRR